MALVPTPGDGFGVGILDASDLNSKLVAPLLFLLGKPRARMRQTVAQSVSNTTFTAITFDVEDFDQAYGGSGGHSTSVNTSRWTCEYPGRYFVAFTVGFVNNTTGQRLGQIYKNGTGESGTAFFVNTTASTWPSVNQGGALVTLAVADYIEVYCWQNSGSALNTSVTQTYEQSSMSVFFVGTS